MGVRRYPRDVAKARNQESIMRNRFRYRLLAVEFEKRHPREFDAVRRQINQRLDEERGPMPGDE